MNGLFTDDYFRFSDQVAKNAHTLENPLLNQTS